MFVRKRTSKKAEKGYTWTVYIDYEDSYGVKQRYTKGGFQEKSEALNHGIEKQQELKQGIEIKLKDKTFSEVYLEYMDVEGKFKYTHNTMITYDSIYVNHIKDGIGNAKMRNLSYKALQEYFNGICDEGMGTTTGIKRIFCVTFKYALRVGYINSNPMLMVTVRGKKSERKQDDIITFEQLEEMVKILCTVDEKKRNYVPFTHYSFCIFLYLSYFLGTRKAETLAITKQDVDFENNTISINKQLVYHGFKKEEYYCTDKMKTKSSRAILPMCDKLKEILQKWYKKNPYDLLCCDEYGDYIVPTDCCRLCKESAKKIGIDFHPHSLRHTYISNLVLSGVDVKTVSELARHSNTSTTLDIYAQTTFEKKQEAINCTFNAYLDTKSNKKVTNLKNDILN